ncbi:unnamed protein product [Malus baccata var. baccata]
MKRTFLEKLFPTSRVILLRKKINGIQQNQRELFPAYYERFKGLVASCPQHQMKEEMLLQHFYEGLLPIERQMLDASAGDVLIDKTPVAAKVLIVNQALNAQRYEGVGGREPPRQQHINVVSAISEIKSQLTNLTLLVSQGGKLPMPWAIKAKTSHGMIHTLIPTIRAREIIQISNGGNLNNPNNKEDIYNYLPGSIKGQSCHHNFQHNLPKQTQGQQNQAKEISEVKKQIGQISKFMGQFREKGKLPSSTIVNPKGGFETAKAIMLRSGKEVGITLNTSKSSQTEEEKLLFEEEELDKATARKKSSMPQPLNAPKPSNLGKGDSILTHSNPIPPNAPFPCRFMQSKKEKNENDIFETFRKVQVNIPLLDASKQVPRYVKFLKELCTTKKGISNKEVVKVNDLVFPADFYVLEMEDSAHSTPLPILLGRPFMKTARTKIDVFKGTLTMEFDGDAIDFNLSESIKYPKDDHSCFFIDVFDALAQDYLDSLNEDALETTIA